MTSSAPAPDLDETGPVARGLIDAIDRTFAAILDETRELRRNTSVDYARHRHRKDICLLDLTRRGHALGAADPGPQTRAALRSLRDAIIDNQTMLRIHLNAAREVSNILIDVMVEAESDRTYGRERAKRTPPR